MPPNDPRIVDLTDEQMELDIKLFLDDHPELKKKAEVYNDDEYTQTMNEELGETADSSADYQEGLAAVERGETLPTPSDLEEVPFDD